jgi:hypothetical protein
VLFACQVGRRSTGVDVLRSRFTLRRTDATLVWLPTTAGGGARGLIATSLGGFGTMRRLSGFTLSRDRLT